MQDYTSFTCVASAGNSSRLIQLDVGRSGVGGWRCFGVVGLGLAWFLAESIRSDHAKCDLAGNAFAATCILSVLTAVVGQCTFAASGLAKPTPIRASQKSSKSDMAMNLLDCFNEATSQSLAGSPNNNQKWNCLGTSAWSNRSDVGWFESYHINIIIHYCKRWRLPTESRVWSNAARAARGSLGTNHESDETSTMTLTMWQSLIITMTPLTMTITLSLCQCLCLWTIWLNKTITERQPAPGTT